MAFDLSPRVALYRQRRDRLAQQLLAAGGGVAVLAAAPEQLRNGTTPWPYRHDNHLYWLTGLTEPDAMLVLVAEPGRAPESVLFCRTRDPEREIWEGPCLGPEAAQAQSGVTLALPQTTCDAHLPTLLADRTTVFCALGDGGLEARVHGWLRRVRAGARRGVSAPQTLSDVRPLIDALRLTKDAHEIGLMHRAGAIAAAAHVRAMQACRPGMMEYALEAELLYEFRRQGAQFPAYGTIVAGGANACILHYVANDQPLHAGDLVLIDAGCELDGYASDITRTFPVDGRFTGPQRAVYDIVLAAQHAALAAVAPGASFNAPHDAAVAVLAQGLLDLGVLQGSVAEVIESGSYRRFYMHRTSHWLGMDVHDVGDYRTPGRTLPAAVTQLLTPAMPEGTADAASLPPERPWRALEPGMVLTIEPGLYLRAGDDVPAALQGIGIRIEDDALVTAQGHTVLTAAVPTDAQAIEALMRQ